MAQNAEVEQTRAQQQDASAYEYIENFRDNTNNYAAVRKYFDAIARLQERGKELPPCAREHEFARPHPAANLSAPSTVSNKEKTASGATAASHQDKAKRQGLSPKRKKQASSLEEESSFHEEEEPELSSRHSSSPKGSHPSSQSEQDDDAEDEDL